MIFKKYLSFSYLLSILVLLCLINCHSVFSQSPEYRNFNVKDGLPSSEVYQSMQDSKGYMWFATDRGVCRFDGYQFKTFTTSDGLADNTIFECQEDYKGRIWFRSMSGKLSYFYHDSIYRLSINDSLSKLIKTSFFLSMAVDTTDNMYLGYYTFTEGIIRIDLRNHNSLSVVPLPPQMSYIIVTPGGGLLSGNTFYRKSGTLLPKYRAVNLYRVDPATHNVIKVRSWAWTFPEKNQIHDQAIALHNGQIAISVASDFLILDTTLTKPYYYKRFTDETILNISEDKAANIWLSFQSTPTYFSNGNFIDRHLPSYLKDSHVSSVITDREGGTWFTTLYGGVYYVGSLDFKTYTSANGLPGNKITALTVTKNGTIWAAAERSNKIAVIDNDSISYHVLPNIEGLSINDILFTRQKEVWISATGGLFVYKDNTLFEPVLSSLVLGQYKLLANSDGTLWVNNYSIMRLIERTDNKIKQEKFIRVNSKIFATCKAPDESVWLGTLKGLWNMKNDSLINYGDKYPILNNRIEDITLTANNDLWIATQDTGVIVKQGEKITHITNKDGLLSNFCTCLSIDYKGNIWVGTNKGISHIILSHSNSGKLIDTVFNINAPNLIEVNKIVSNNDTVYAATNNGATVFNMNKVTYNKIPPPIYITSLKINNKSWPLDKSFDLHYDENYLLISFVGLTYKDAGNELYRYKMEGIDTGWLYTRNRDIQYPKLTSGSYTFVVCAMNNDGVWSKKPASINFTIEPPFWATWWARGLFIFIIISFIYWRFKLIESRTKRNAEVNKQLVTMELRELKAQMDPHFLFNNLNTLTHLVELKSDDAPEFVEELAKYYRYSLQFRNAEFTILENEIKQAERYLHILRIRFGDNMKLQWNINEPFRQYYIATYSLQLLLENVIKHNIVSVNKPLWVEISTTDNSLIVKNQIQPKNSSELSNGHGLKSIGQRYQLLTKKKITISQTPQYFSVELPLITPTEYESINS